MTVAMINPWSVFLAEPGVQPATLWFKAIYVTDKKYLAQQAHVKIQHKFKDKD